MRGSASMLALKAVHAARYAPWSVLRALLTLQVESRHAIAVLSALKSSLSARREARGLKSACPKTHGSSQLEMKNQELKSAREELRKLRSAADVSAQVGRTVRPAHAPSASQFGQRALLTPWVSPGSRHRCGESSLRAAS